MNPPVLLQGEGGAPVSAAELNSAPSLPSARELQAVPSADASNAPAVQPETPLVGPSRVPPAQRPGLLRRMKHAARQVLNTLLSVAGKGDDTLALEAPLARINALGPTFAAMSDVELKGMTGQLKARIAAGETLESVMPEAYAVAREAAGRALGYKPYDVQVQGAIAMFQGKIAEMRTGEGKTLTATMPAYLHALTGKGVHVVTVNQTLAERDAENMGKVYDWLGMSVGVVPQEPEKIDEKRAAYKADITYVTNYSLGFDYLRDNMTRRADDKVCRDPYFALIDEVDEILIDEARTPLILSRTESPSAREYQRFSAIMKTLEPGKDYKVDYKQRQCWLTDDGLTRVESQLGVDNLYSEQNMPLVPYLRASLQAHTLFVRDKDYMVADGKVDIVDEFTGRVMEGRRYNDGIHQALEAKEGVEVQPEQTTMASITYPNLFRRYEKVAGMSGTAKTEEAEFQELYAMNVAVIPPNRPSQRVDKPDLVFKTQHEKFDAVADRVQRLYEEGKPVLIGTRNVATNEYLHQLLDARGVPHQVLSARSVQDNTAAENEIIARAGKSGMITLATNMAGRGVDIKPDLVNFKMLTTEAVEAVRGGQRVMIVLSKRSEAEDARLWLGVNQVRVADGEPKLAEVGKMAADSPSSGASATPPEVQLVIDDGTAVATSPGTVVLRAADPRFATGGLHIVGTERHESRRIDNQLKGRAGRQGNPGETQFFLSLDDEIMRLFGGDRLKGVFDGLGVKKGEAVSDGLLDRAIGAAQKKIEGMHFDVRKNTTKYDGVLNIHRGLYYKDREAIVGGADVSAMLGGWVGDGLDRMIADANLGRRASADEAAALWDSAQKRFALPAALRPAILEGDDKIEVARLRTSIVNAVEGHLSAQRIRFGDEMWKAALRDVTLDLLDDGWVSHLENMQMLQTGIGLEAYAQKDPWIAYQERGFEEWNAMKADVAANVLRTAVAA